MKVAIIGAGLAGSEAAIVLARAGVEVALFEMRPIKTTPAHETDKPAELVCSNSLKSDELPSAHGILKAELKRLNSPLLEAAYKTRVAAGSAVAVDRDKFSDEVQSQINSCNNINYKIEECAEPPQGYDYTIIATGPLSSDKITNYLIKNLGAEQFNFYDAVAPIISADSINTGIAFFADRWDKGSGDGDYLNCPFTKEQYDKFYNAVIEADLVKARDFEKAQFFEACLPIEVGAKRGYDVLRFSMMKPVGLVDKRKFPILNDSELANSDELLNKSKTKSKRGGGTPAYFAVCQLRKENAEGTAYNMVGFQTRMTIGEQREVFRLIPGLENAEFLRFGSIHRNSYIDSPRLLNKDLSLKSCPNIFVAGQLCGNEGYTESIATGHFAALAILAKIKGQEIEIPNSKTALGALLKHIVPEELSENERGTTVVGGQGALPFSPSNINFSLFAAPEDGLRLKKADKKEYYCKRAQEEFDNWRKKH